MLNIKFFLVNFFFLYLLYITKLISKGILINKNPRIINIKYNFIYFYKKKYLITKNIYIKLNAKKFDQKEIKRKKNKKYALQHMFDKNGKRIKQINKEKKSLKKKKIFDYIGFKVDKLFNCLSEDDINELKEEELKRKSGEILHNNKYIDTYGVETENGNIQDI